jgi:hypothetical protein
MQDLVWFTGTRIGRDWFPHVSICPRVPRIALKVDNSLCSVYHSPSLPSPILYIYLTSLILLVDTPTTPSIYFDYTYPFHIDIVNQT